MRKTLLALLSFVTLTMTAQTKITFDGTTADYKAVGVYDTWEESPFRTGTLKGNAQVIANFTAGLSTDGVSNETDSIVGVQRSRFGSNTFGVRIDLTSPWATSETTQYVHVLVYKPNTSKVLLVGLGKRNTSAFTDEPITVEQFWVESQYDYTKANQWTDMVFPVQTVTGVQIYSLVVVPDLQSPHSYQQDFACYIDQIEINSNSAQRGNQGGDYPVNFSKDQNNTRATERCLKGVSLTGTDNVSYSYSPATSDSLYNKVYKDVTETVTWDVKPGGTYTPAVSYQGNWMHAYAYIDYDNDGQFTPVVGSNQGAGSGSEAVSWSAYAAGNTDPLYNSAGTALSGSNRNTLSMPSFTIPSSIAPGIYRMRFKVDWNCIDAAGGDGSDSKNMQSIINNGGGIIDVLLNIHADQVTVNAQARNGAVTASDETALNDYHAPFGQQLGLLVTPAAGFQRDSLVVRHGYNLDGKQYAHHNRQWQQVTYAPTEIDSDGSFTLPADIIDGNVNIEGNFRQKDYVVLDETKTLAESVTDDEYDIPLNVELRRSLSTENYNTMVLPFDMTVSQIAATFGSDAQVYTYSNANGTHIHFSTSASGIQANVPFLLKSSTAETIFHIDGVTLKQSTSPAVVGTNYDFVGNYGGNITLSDGLWFLSANTFYRSTGKSTLKGYRAYFQEHPESSAKGNGPVLYIDNTSTGIHAVTNDESNSKVYNLGGQEVSGDDGQSLPDGVYIKKNHKVVVK